MAVEASAAGSDRGAEAVNEAAAGFAADTDIFFLVIGSDTQGHSVRGFITNRERRRKCAAFN
jgi:hypothetical protein